MLIIKVGIKVFLFIIVCIYSFCELNAQQINELKEKKQSIEKEIENISNLIVKTENESSTSLNNIKLTKKKIELKNSLIRQIDNENDQIKNQINFRKSRIDSLKNQITIIKMDYRALIVYTQKKGIDNSFLMLILASKDLNQAYKRIKFYQQILKYKETIAQKYNRTILNIKEENDKLNDNVNALTKKQLEKTIELKRLKEVETGYLKKVTVLNHKRKELLAELENQKRISLKINDEIKRLIEEEARKELEDRKKGNKVLEIQLSSNFKENVGKFRLPVNNGVVTGTYGESFHPILKEIKVKNNGVDITLTQKSEVYSIYKGTVKKIFKVPGSNLAIIIRHGNYLTVYTNLTSINVSVGQEVNSYQKIGVIEIQRGESSTNLHFELWNENKTEDPSKWFIDR
jgi:septal ring factor EnvC (AmiA/AmiB activator)